MNDMEAIAADFAKEHDNRRCVTAQLSKLVNRVNATIAVLENGAARYKNAPEFGKAIASVLRLSVRESLEPVDDSEIEPALTYLASLTQSASTKYV